MPRNMSFAITTQQVRDREKDITRRLAWWDVEPGDVLNAVVKGMGLKKGEKVEKIHTIEVRCSRGERLDKITKKDCIREGFPNLSPKQFVDMFCEHNKAKGCTPKTFVNRIVFKYLD